MNNKIQKKHWTKICQDAIISFFFFCLYVFMYGKSSLGLMKKDIEGAKHSFET